MSSALAAAKAGLTIGEEENGKYLLLEQPRHMIKLERSSLPPHLRREFDSLAKATSEIKDRDRT